MVGEVNLKVEIMSMMKLLSMSSPLTPRNSPNRGRNFTISLPHPMLRTPLDYISLQTALEDVDCGGLEGQMESEGNVRMQAGDGAAGTGDEKLKKY